MQDDYVKIACKWIDDTYQQMDNEEGHYFFCHYTSFSSWLEDCPIYPDKITDSELKEDIERFIDFWRNNEDLFEMDEDSGEYSDETDKMVDMTTDLFDKYVEKYEEIFKELYS